MVRADTQSEAAEEEASRLAALEFGHRGPELGERGFLVWVFS